MSTFEWHFGLGIFSDYDADGFLGIQIDAFGEERSGMPEFEALHPFGFASRQQDPEEGVGGGVLYFFIGGQAFAIPVSDPRAVQLFPPLAKGSSVQYAHTKNGKKSFDVHNGDNGTKTVYVEVDDSAHLLTIGVDGNGKAVLELAHALGQALTMLDESMVAKNAAGDAYIEWNPQGITGNGNLKWNGAAMFGNPAAAFPLAKFAELAAWCTAIQAHLAAITTLLNGPGAVTGANGALTTTLAPTVSTALTLNTSGATQLLSGA